MDREKLIKQLFVGKVTEIIGTEKTMELLKDATVAIDDMLKSRKADVSISLERAKKYARHQHFLGTQGSELVEFEDWGQD